MSKKFGVRFNGFSISDVISLVKQTETAETAAQGTQNSTVKDVVYNYPPTNLNLPGPVPAGTVNGYGTALWTPSGYPVSTQPYLTTDGRVVLRPLNQVISANQASAALPYVLAALQYAVSTYAPVPYSVQYMNAAGNGQSKVNMALTDITSGMEFTLFYGNDDWLQLPRVPSSLDNVLSAAKKYIPAIVTLGFNGLVPGLGTQLENAVNAASGNTLLNLPNPTTTAIQNSIAASTNSLLSTDPSSLILYAIIAVVIIFIIILIASR